MRIASRILGIVLALTGLGFTALPFYVYAVGQWGPLEDVGSWFFGLACIAVGVGCAFGGRYFLRLDFDTPDQAQEKSASAYAGFLLSHRREWKTIAQSGLLFSLIRFAAACFNVNWPGRWADWCLILSY